MIVGRFGPVQFGWPGGDCWGSPYGASWGRMKWHDNDGGYGKIADELIAAVGG
jgi:hypothetical protein